ncbi:MAG TPA: hypothetical protein VHF69_11280, partial [Candidatus Synoicihabitans sp.]|nr:hypothetical protein [Candidatus Synoicihabitans sp.]
GRMRRSHPALVFLVALSLGLSRAAGAGLNLFSNSWGDVIVMTDMTPEGRELTPPTTEQPVYYLGRSLGCRFGSIPGDRLPDVKAMNDFVAEVLAKQGYVGARSGVHEPTLFLVVQWGYLQPRSGDLLWFLGYNPQEDIAAPVFPGMVGPEVLRRNFRSRTIETILQSASEPIYGIIITAFEFESASTPEPIIYWQTRIGLPARGKSMAMALPTMVLAAGPSIGRETSSPVLRNTDDLRQGRVELGEPEVVRYEESLAPLNRPPTKSNRE